MSEQLYTVTAAAKELGISRQRLYDWMEMMVASLGPILGAEQHRPLLTQRQVETLRRHPRTSGRRAGTKRRAA